MKSKVLLMLLVPHSSGCSTSFSGTELFIRLKVLIFDLGLFLFDVGSDIYNGITFIDDGNKIWGIIILGVILIPMTVLYAGIAINAYRDEDSSQRKKLLILFFAPILAAPAIPILTVYYIVYVTYVFSRRCIQPGFDDKDEDNVSPTRILKLCEAVCEANLQAVLVTYVTLVIGLSSDSTFSRFMQIGGILASLLSVAKTCCEWHLKYSDEYEKDPNLTTTMKALLFFAPHVLWRTTATAFVAAFLKFYSLVPLAVHLLVCSGITCFLHKRHHNRLDNSFFSFALSLFTPCVTLPEEKFDQSLLKAIMLTSSLILLPCLIFVRLLPSLSPETVLCTLGLSHLDLDTPIPGCSPCFNTTAVSTGTPCVMATSLEDFSNYLFIPLLILGSWCLFEEVAFMGWPLPYRMLPSIKEDAEEENPQVQVPMLDIHESS